LGSKVGMFGAYNVKRVIAIFGVGPLL